MKDSWILSKQLSILENIHTNSGCFLCESVVNLGLKPEEIVVWCRLHIEDDKSPDFEWSILSRHNKKYHKLD
jgi:hypothetical protein